MQHTSMYVLFDLYLFESFVIFGNGSNLLCVKDTNMQNERALISDHLFQKYPENLKVVYFLTVSIVFSVYKENFTAQ